MTDPNLSSHSKDLPSWDEFNMSHDEETIHSQQQQNNPGPSNDFFDDGNEPAGPSEVCEPGQPEEFGPCLPPGFGADESVHPAEESDFRPRTDTDATCDFSIPTESYELEDPEDPLQGSSNGPYSSQKRTMGPQIPPSVLPKINHQKSADEPFGLPTLGSQHTFNDFIPVDQPCSSSQQQCSERVIGPAIPPEFLISADNSVSSSAPVADGDDFDCMGPALPPDEPQCSSSSGAYQQSAPPASSTNPRKAQKRSAERHIGPTLPSGSSDEEEEEEEVHRQSNGTDTNGRGNEAAKALLNGQKRNEEEEEEFVIGPMPPAPDKTEEEEHMNYLHRLARLESEKHEQSKGQKREEWMTELPQKMLKSGAFGLSAKTSFSRTSAAPSTGDSSAWTSVPNGKSAAGPSTSKSGAKPAPKRSEKDEWEEQRASELNKGRSESLLDQHQKRRKLDSASSSSGSLITTETGERRPFNRDTDIGVRGGPGGSGGAKSLKERMGELSNRFGHGAERKFL